MRWPPGNGACAEKRKWVSEFRHPFIGLAWCRSSDPDDSDADGVGDESAVEKMRGRS